MTIAKKLKTAESLTDKQERLLNRQLTQVYTESFKSIRKQISDFVAKHGVDGKLNQVEAMKYKRLQSLEKEILTELSNLSKGVNKLTVDTAVETYRINYYHTGFAMETEAQIKLGFSTINKEAVKVAIANPLDKVALENNAIAVKRSMQRTLAQAVVQGDSIPAISKKIKRDLEVNANNATRIARTEMTRVMNQGRMDGFVRAEAKGIELQKVWVATLDGDTRSSHQHLDGEKRALDKPFSNGLMEPGDYSGSAEEVINCRCTMITELAGYPTEAAYRRDNVTKEVIPYKTYDEWAENRLKNSN